MKTLFAIGNPGTKYLETYHSLGLLFAKFLKNHYQATKIKENLKYTLTKLTAQSGELLLIESKLFMNESGRALTEFKHKITKLLVAHDDLTLGKFQIKIKYGEGAAGHNGLRSIVSIFQNPFWRIRIGIDHPKNFSTEMQVSDYVLARIDNMPAYNQAFAENIYLIEDFLKD